MRFHCAVAGVVCGAQAGEEVPLRQTWLGGVQRLPSRQLGEVGQRGEEAARPVVGVAAIVQHQRDGADLRVDMAETGSPATFVVEHV
jgi:hypothetical protein